jgi:hypothetical protein
MLFAPSAVAAEAAAKHEGLPECAYRHNGRRTDHRGFDLAGAASSASDHWLTEVIEAAEESRPVSALEGNLADMHHCFGIAILALVAVRLVLRLKNGAPPAPPETSGAIELAGRVSHWLFYALLVVVPVTGLLGTVMATRVESGTLMPSPCSSA